MHIMITGANGFVGRALARRIQDDAQLGGRSVSRLTLIDLAFDGPTPTAPFIRQRAGDLADAAWLASELAEAPLDVIFHLASIPGGSAEKNYPLGRAVNIDATLQLLESGKTQVDAGGGAPLFLFASSIAVFGDMPEPVDDHTPLHPQMTYGAQKVVGEVMLDEFSRRGWVDGRSLRLPGVLARPPAPTGQLSAFISDIIRELAAGRPFVCPTSPDATTWASSLPCIVGNLIHGATLPEARLGKRRAFTLPTLRFSMAELVTAIGKVHDVQVEGLVRYEPNERIEALFGRFPTLETPAANRAGFYTDDDLEMLVRRAID